MSTGGSASFDPREIFAALIGHQVAFVTVGAFALVAIPASRRAPWSPTRPDLRSP